MNYKVVELIKIYNFYFDHLLIRQSGTIHCSQIYIKRYVKFVNNVTITLLDEMIKIKTVDLNLFYNFYVHEFFR